ncbi:alginate lyase family protein, partial [candidate division KSB1 bacterium]|nr:alginate lyase family protein [candidate division KSB1 bacterium]
MALIIYGFAPSMYGYQRHYQEWKYESGIYRGDQNNFWDADFWLSWNMNLRTKITDENIFAKREPNKELFLEFSRTDKNSGGLCSPQASGFCILYYDTHHRELLRRMSIQVAALWAAYRVTADNTYAHYAFRHLHAWFIDDATRMNPNLSYAQAIKGVTKGRGVGIIDTIHLVEMARAVSILKRSPVISDDDYDTIRKWFADYLLWMTTSENGIDERERKNHGTCWVMQVAEFAGLVGNLEMLAWCRERFKTVLLPNQMALDGSFPLELERTKPYGYSLFNLDALATVCQILSTKEDVLWTFQFDDGRGMRKAMAFHFPFIEDKSRWPYPADVMYFDQWPVRHPCLLFAGLAFKNINY